MRLIVLVVLLLVGCGAAEKPYPRLVEGEIGYPKRSSIEKGIWFWDGPGFNVYKAKDPQTGNTCYVCYSKMSNGQPTISCVGAK
jgi:hypothetical protein